MTTLAFWHTFDHHGGESPEEIIARKRQEISANRWTLWSFRHMTTKTIESWIETIRRSKQKNILVLCSASNGAKDPQKKGKSKLAKYYREYQGDKWQDWQDIPKYNSEKLKDRNNITIPHPPSSWTQKGLASAFKVSRIILPPPEIFVNSDLIYLRIKPTCDFKWLEMKNGTWQNGDLPTRGECLLKLYKSSKSNGLRPISAILELKEPYVVEISRLKQKS